jgi:hypothetical protein
VRQISVLWKIIFLSDLAFVLNDKQIRVYFYQLITFSNARHLKE